MDVNPKAAGPEHQPYIERMELQPIDAQTNGPQLYYGLRYHTYIVKPDRTETLHDQVGYWLWEKPFQHTDRARLKRIAAPTPNPAARQRF